MQEIEEPALREAAMHYPAAGGKAIRPVVAVLSCEAAGGTAETADPLALSVELLHTFSLVHDDLMDEDATRRGVESVHAGYGDATAILAGDALYALAFEVLGDIGESSQALPVISDVAHTARRLCEGQHLDMTYEETWPTVGEYEAMIAKKTASLFACAARNGARLSGDGGEASGPLGAFGHALGLGFQIQDDVLDLAGDPDAIGKPVASDIRAGKKTHPILVAHDRADENEREVLEAVMADADATDEEIEWVLNLVHETGAFEVSGDRAESLLEGARGRLAGLPGSPAREALMELTRSLADRDR